MIIDHEQTTEELIMPAADTQSVQGQRRRWTNQQKQDILNECLKPGMTVSAVGHRHGISTNLLFQWRKRFQGGSRPTLDDAGDIDQPSEYEAILARIRKYEALADAVHDKLLLDLESNKISAYNAACGFANLVNAFGKLAHSKLDLLDNRIAARNIEDQDGGVDRDEVPYQVEQEAERLCLILVKQRIAEKQATQAAEAGGAVRGNASVSQPQS